MSREEELKLANLRGWWARELGLKPGASVEAMLKGERYMRYMELNIPGASWEEIFTEELRRGHEPRVPEYAPEELAGDLRRARLVVERQKVKATA